MQDVTYNTFFTIPSWPWNADCQMGKMEALGSIKRSGLDLPSFFFVKPQLHQHKFKQRAYCQVAHLHSSFFFDEIKR